MPATVDELRQQLSRWEQAHRPAGGECISSGCPALDQLLPEGGLARGTLVEWLAPSGGCGAGTLALAAARQACHDDGPLVVVDGQNVFYPPAAARADIDLERLIVVRTRRARDEVWALEQALRSPGVGAVLCWSGRLSSRHMRRLQLAAESGTVVGLLVLPASVRNEPCWAAARLWVEPVSSLADASGSSVAWEKTGPVYPQQASLSSSLSSRRLRVELLRSRVGRSGGAVELEVDNETGAVHLAPPLVRAAFAQRSTSA